MKRKPGDGLCKYPYTGIHCCCLHGRPLIDSLSAGCAAEEKAVCVAEQAVFWLVPCFEQAGKYSHRHHSPKNRHKKRATY